VSAEAPPTGTGKSVGLGEHAHQPAEAAAERRPGGQIGVQRGGGGGQRGERAEQVADEVRIDTAVTAHRAARSACSSSTSTLHPASAGTFAATSRPARPR
jgi:hypothetical protein